MIIQTNSFLRNVYQKDMKFITNDKRYIESIYYAYSLIKNVLLLDNEIDLKRKLLHQRHKLIR